MFTAHEWLSIAAAAAPYLAAPAALALLRWLFPNLPKLFFKGV
jgi:hypothetical protein